MTNFFMGECCRNPRPEVENLWQAVAHNPGGARRALRITRTRQGPTQKRAFCATQDMIDAMTAMDDRLGHVVKSLEQELSGAKDAVLRPMGLTVPQYSALLVIAETPGISGAELARQCLVTPQTMTTVLGNLTVKGLIERRTVPGQGRAMETTITRSGKTLLARADKKVEEVEGLLSGQLTKTDQATLRKLLEKCRAAFADGKASFAEEAAPAAARPARKAPAKKVAATRPAKKAATKKTAARAKKKA
jgi:DNA-binding MarR family transcriptional regulator